MNPEDNPMPLVSECNPVDAVECPCCLTVFRVRTLMTDGERAAHGRRVRGHPHVLPHVRRTARTVGKKGIR